MSDLADLLAVIEKMRTQELKYELEKLQAVWTWAIEQFHLDYEPGDRVVIVSPEPSRKLGGWTHYSEALATGRTGILAEIDFDPRKGEWYVVVGMDRAWSVGEAGRRYWYGPAHLTPEGFEPPSEFDQKTHPEGRVKHFYMDPSWVQKFKPEEPPVDKTSPSDIHSTILDRAFDLPDGTEVITVDNAIDIIDFHLNKEG